MDANRLLDFVDNKAQLRRDYPEVTALIDAGSDMAGAVGQYLPVWPEVEEVRQWWDAVKAWQLRHIEDAASNRLLAICVRELGSGDNALKTPVPRVASVRAWLEDGFEVATPSAAIEYARGYGAIDARWTCQGLKFVCEDGTVKLFEFVEPMR